jgi:uncharacterized lipoprotein
MTRNILASLVLATVAATTLAACGSSTEVQQVSVSQGQELMDLKKALDSGALSQKEYDRLREEIIRRNR